MKLLDIQARCDRVPFFRHLGFSVTEVNDMQILAIMPFEQRHIGNPMLDTYHGGIIASFMEAIASLTVLGDLNSPPPKPVNLTVDYLRPGLPGTLNARASILRRGRRIASVETTAWLDDEGKPVAKGLFHFLLV
ncbi:thioesterase [Loktanella sp. 1ANDIMAR09]|jgi:uncharacterized protein (TIGR00369 family)|uniref:PaaI family thioesterase n=1 Tax=Loktanella sp. 5RATIMAR09 TaxID=1225655 RepID=UPI0006DC6A6F|nr:PaaI family thioesterase [Loktanella sp. 5RATIMAR09]KQB95631.1 thioesterase [Loktanella sp. 1ANDIMAR09]KQI70464.1 thioesterase [Loktanella sp. 5RATIMAR09]